MFRTCTIRCSALTALMPLMPLMPLMALMALMALALSCDPAYAGQSSAAGGKHETYSDDEVVSAANDFFKNGAQDLGKVLEKVLKEKGQPVAIIRGEEAGGAIGVGLRYGHGELAFKGRAGQKVYWQGPSIGFDVGANAVKVFALVYGLPGSEKLFQRFPGAEGSLYFVGGFGVNYVQKGSTVIAPVRFGVGWRQGLSLSYMKFSSQQTINPF
jgi:hypothetical protein